MEIIDHFCGSKFWDANLTWYTDTPDLTPCMEKSLATFVPFVFVVLFVWIDLYDIICSNTGDIPWNQFNKMKLLLCTGIFILGVIDFIYVALSLKKGFVFPIDLCTALVKIILMIVTITLIFAHRKKGIRSSGLLFLMWALLVLLAVPQLSTVIEKYTLKNYILLDLTFFVYFVFALGALGLNFFADAEPLYAEYPKVTNPCPEYNASFPSQLLFSWFSLFILRGFRRPLTNSDLWNLNYEDMSRAVIPQFDKYWNAYVAKNTRVANQKNAAIQKKVGNTEDTGKTENAEPKPTSILPCLCKCFGPTFLFGAFLRLIQVLLSFVSPLILKLLIDFVEGEEPQWRGYAYACVLLITATIQSLLLSQYFKKMILIGLRIRSSLISIIYRKALKLSNAARKGSTVGEIVNLMAVDAQRFMDLVTFLNLLWSVPLTIAIALYFLWQTLGPSVMAGFAVMIILIPINGVIGNRVRALQVVQMKNKDERIKMMNEILSGIKVLKLYAWEPSFQKQVMNVREKEIKVLRQASYLNALSSFVWACAPFLVSLVTFTVYVMSDEKNILDAQKAFVALSLFNMIKFPLAMLPMLIASMIQTSVSIKRINKFMNSEEIDPSCISHDYTIEETLLMEDGSFRWGEDDPVILKNINIKVKPKSLVAIVGSVGSGKSSLLSAFLGEMEKVSGKVNTKGSIAYVSQIAWIQNATLRENILFGNAYNSKRYDKVVTACALKPDFDMLPAGDRTEIGEKGINLSGGQKQRVSLARAVYYNSDVYFLDDPLSAVDSHVGKHLFDNIIGPNGILQDKTRLLVTHSITFLPEVDFIIVLKDGSISETGTYRELLNKRGAFSEFLTTHGQEVNENDGKEDEEMEGTSEMSLTKQISQSNSIKRRKLSAHSLIGSDGSTHYNDKLIEDEKTEEGKVKWLVYRHYLKSTGLCLSISTLLLTVLNQGFSIGSNFWISTWTNDKNLAINGTQDINKRNMYLEVYALFGVGDMVSLMLSSLTMALGCVYASISLHIFMLKNILHSPMSFFDTTPIGRIVNRFAKDIDTVDNVLPPIIRGFIYTFFGVVSTLVVISISTPIFISVIIPVALLYYFIQKFFIATSRQLKRLESVTRSPIYSHFGETINGCATIRAYNVQHRFVKESEEKVDFNQIAAYPGIIANRWLAVRLEFIGNIIIFFAALFTVLGRETLNPGIVGLSITYALQITQSLNWLVRMTAEVETNIVSVERIKEYGEVQQEAPWEVKPSPVDQNWPSKGEVEFRNVKVRYRKGLDLVLKGLSFNINANEKVGIVGRTGAGKSSMTLSLFRIIEAADGAIFIDNVDISKVGLHTLRSRITIIPQDPILFSGPLRFNLDPFESYNDEQIWNVLKLAHLKNYVSKLPNKLQYNISEGGENLSVGQKQLICLARALLRKSKLLVLDEATAAIDLDTDKFIQETIQSEFTNCTVLTIAHRINTIMDSDRVMVLDKGVIVEFDSPRKLLKNRRSIFYDLAKDAGLV